MYKKYSNSSPPISWYIILLVICIFLIAIGNSCSINESREKQNMVPIEEGFAYDANTKIIYKEFFHGGGRTAKTTSYTPYISENGNYYQYIGGEWVEIIDE